MKFLILSDLHTCITNQVSGSSRLIFDKGKSDFGIRFINYCKESHIKPDFLVCPGDISNQGCTRSFQQGWEFLNEIKSELGIDYLLCVPGNHDLQSRPDNSSFSPLHNMKFCSPSFPTDKHSFNTHFWGWNWGHREFEKFNCILLNSSAYHGVNCEYKHGRVAPETVEQIVRYIQTDSFVEKPFNLLLCHHHPLKREDIDYGADIEVMEGGQLLLSKLEKVTDTPWLVIHGHKHFASLFSGQSAGFNPPLIFSAGSFSAKLYPEIENRAINQFYILDINIEKTCSEEKLFGTFEAHSWNLEHDWHISKNPNFLSTGGFGSDVRPKQIITMLNELLVDTEYLDANDLEPVYEILKYCTPTMYSELISKLNAEFHYELSGSVLLEVAKK